MFCNKCGKQIADRSTFCMYCGNDFSGVRVVKGPGTQQAANPVPSMRAQTAQQNGGMRILKPRACPACCAPLAQDSYVCEYCETTFIREEPQVQQQYPMQPVQVTQVIQQGDQRITWGDAAKIAVTNGAVRAGTSIATEVAKGVIRSFLPW